MSINILFRVFPFYSPFLGLSYLLGPLTRPFFSVFGIILSVITLVMGSLVRGNPLGVGITLIIFSTICNIFSMLPLAALLMLIAGIFALIEHSSRRKRLRRRISDPSRRKRRWEPQGPPTPGRVPRTRSTIREEDSPQVQGDSFCPSCGSQMEPDDRFCVNCGSSKTG